MEHNTISYGYSSGYREIVDFHRIASTGLSFEGAQEINKAIALSDIRLREHNGKKEIDNFWSQQNNRSTPGASVPIDCKPPDLVALGEAFIKDKQVVKKRSTDPTRGRWVYFLRDVEYNRHVPIAEDALKRDYADYVFDNTKDPRWDDETAMRHSSQRMLHLVPRLEESCMEILEPTRILAQDSLFDIKCGTLIPKLVSPRGIFTTSSIPISLLGGQRETPAFDALLKDCFAGNEQSIKRAKEIIGALISPIKFKRSMFIFQGLGNGGKSRLARLIVRHILRGAGVFVGNDFSDLGSEDLKRADTPFSLVYIRDSVDKTVAPKQRSWLKSFCDGGYDDLEPTFKFLICTNHAIYTGENGFVEKPLLNRIVVLSFPKAMDNEDPLVADFEELHLENELPAIVLSCLIAFSEVLQNGGQYSGTGELNAVIEQNVETPLLEGPKSDSKTALVQALDSCFALCNEADPEMTTARIMSIVQNYDSSFEVSPETVGRVVREHFGKDLAPKRSSSGMYYNLRRR